METFSALLAICADNSPVSGEFPAQRPETRSFDVFFDLCPNKRWSKQSWGWWFDTPSGSLWRHSNVCVCLSFNVVFVGSDNGLRRPKGDTNIDSSSVSPQRTSYNRNSVKIQIKLRKLSWHYIDVIMGTMASQITRLTIVYWTVYSSAHQRKYQRSASLAFVRGIHRWPVNSPHKWQITLKMFPFDYGIME